MDWVIELNKRFPAPDIPIILHMDTMRSYKTLGDMTFERRNNLDKVNDVFSIMSEFVDETVYVISAYSTKAVIHDMILDIVCE